MQVGKKPIQILIKSDLEMVVIFIKLIIPICKVLPYIIIAI